MASSIQERKQALRREVRAALDVIPPALRAIRSESARAKLESQALWQNAASILFYAPGPTELDVWPLVSHALTTGKSVVLPRFVLQSNTYIACQIHDAATDLKSGQFGIREPADHCGEVSLNRLDLILVPGVAFDLDGRRLGRGKGFYDRLLAAVRGTTCGVAFDEQIAGEITVEPHDIRVNCILTPTRWIEL